MDRSKSWAGSPKRLSTLVATAWCCLCALTCCIYAPSASETVRGMLLLYFQPLLPIALAAWLWGHVVHRFSTLKIDYDACFSPKDRKYLIPHGDIYRLALAFTTLGLTCTALFVVSAVARSLLVADLTPLAVYFLALLFIMAPVDVLARPARLFFGETLARVLVPLQEVSWADFLLADVLTSLSRSSGDLSRVACALIAGPTLHVAEAHHASGTRHTSAQTCSPVAVPVLVALMLPYIIRFIQCITVYRATGKRSQLFNALKYATAFPAIVLTAYEHEEHVAGRRYSLYNVWLAAMFVNSLYSFYWDIEMDWDMPWLMQPGGGHTQALRGALRLPGLRPDLLYPRWWYGWAVGSNLVLRLTWTHRLMGNLENHTLVGVVMVLLEVFRRYQWTFIRVETELRKISAKVDRSHHLSTSSSAISLTGDRSGHAHAHVHVLLAGEGPGGLDEGVGVGDEVKVVVGGGAVAHTHVGHVAHGYAPTN